MTDSEINSFIGSFQHFVEMLDILKMCMWKFDAEKYFRTNWPGFELSHFPMTAPSS